MSHRAIRRIVRAANADAVIASDGRVRIRAAVLRQLRGHPGGRGYRDLAEAAYETTVPSAAQLASVRRAVRKLVDLGLAERDRNADGTTNVRPVRAT